MCGVAGVVNLDGKPVWAEAIAAMNAAQASRGPDGEGVEVLGDVGLGHRRLSIIDLSGGRQPLANEDGTVWVTFNGEIYNHRDLRRELEAAGHQFKTHCDTEAIVHAYEAWGSDCVRRFNGMFAFAVFDVKARKLFLARDRMGQKPLCYARCRLPNGRSFFAFASELRALMAFAEVPREIDLQSLNDYLALQYVPCPRTIYRDVFKLPPGHTLELSVAEGEPRVSRYWMADYATKTTLGFADAKARLRELVEDAVKIRLMADVPLGAFLSGGVDSTIIAALVQKLGGTPVKTFTIGFDEGLYDERYYARLAAEAIGSDHREKVVNPADFAAVRQLVRHYGEPYSDASMLPTFLLCRYTRETVTVALSGDGADELFAGYYRYLAARYARVADFLPPASRRAVRDLAAKVLPSGTDERSFSGKLRRVLNALAAGPEERYLDIICRFGDDLKSTLFGERWRAERPRPTQEFMGALYAASRAAGPVETIMETDLNSYLPDDILAKVDIASMAASLEARSPFMDYRVVSFAASLPLDYKQGLFGYRKKILIEAFSDLIPETVRKRRKKGFGVPLNVWLRGEWKDLAREILLDGKGVSAGFFDRRGVEAALTAHQNGSADYSYALWALIVFDLWFQEFMGPVSSPAN